MLQDLTTGLSLTLSHFVNKNKIIEFIGFYNDNNIVKEQTYYLFKIYRHNCGNIQQKTGGGKMKKLKTELHYLRWTLRYTGIWN